MPWGGWSPPWLRKIMVFSRPWGAGGPHGCEKEWFSADLGKAGAPGWKKNGFQEALETLTLHPAPLCAVQSVAQGPILHGLTDDGHLRQLISETQASGFWKVKGAEGFKKPMLGSKPGAVPATDIFNLGFAQGG